MSAFRSGRGGQKPYSRPNVNEQWVHDKAPGVKNTLNNDEKPRTPSSTNLPTTKLQVSNLHYEVTPKDLTSIFGQIGTLVREPMIRYDRSGRSSGVAIISYETPAEATRAKKQFDGILAKGQPMSIAYDSGPPRARRAVSGPALINRIQRPALKERLSADDSQIPDSTGPGPVRSRPRRRGGRTNAARPAPKKPKTAEELDKELDAFMGDSDSAPATTSAVDASKASEGKTASGPTEDVDMA
ncbi:RNA-binding domain-containing protein [Marasmius fiardii PR-910]|nr:RNA-binding domain-containing protein [Marasmius fiardii PR-910]